MAYKPPRSLVTTLLTALAGLTVVGALTLTASTLTGNLRPTADDTYDIGTSELRWKDAWFSGDLSASGTSQVEDITIFGTCTGCGGGSDLDALITISSSGETPTSNLLQIQNSIDSARYLTVSSTSTQMLSDIHPMSNDGAGLGLSGTAWSDLFLADGAVINLDAGDITLTHSANTLTIAGGQLSVVDLEVTEAAYFDTEIDDGNSGTSDTIDWSTGNKHKSTVTGAVTYTFTAPGGPTGLTLKLVNGGSQTITWPGTVKWPAATAPTFTVSGTDIVSFYYDGTSYHGAAVLDLQ